MRKYDSPVLVCMLILSCMGVTMVVRYSSAIASSSKQESERASRNRRIAGHRVLRTLERNGRTGTPLLGIEQVFEDKQGRYWLLSAYRVHVFDEKRNEWFPVQIPEHTGINGHSGDNKLWYVPDSVQRSAEPPDITQFPVGFDKMQTMKCFDLTLWHETDLAPETRRAIEQSDSSIFRLFPGRNGKLWGLLSQIGSRCNSVMLYDGHKWRGPIAPEKSGDEECSGAEQAKIGLQDSEGYVWLPGFEVVRYDERKNEWKHYPDAPDIHANAIYEDRKGRIWIGGIHGDVCVYDKTANLWTTHNLTEHQPITPGKRDFDTLSITAIYQDRGGRMMFGTHEGLFTYNEAENKWELATSKNSGLPYDWIHSISEDKSGRIWIGTSDGVVIVQQ